MKQYLLIMILCAMAASTGVLAQDNTAGKDSAQAIGKADVNRIYDAKDGEEKEKLYLDLLSRFPPEQASGSHKEYDMARETVALGFARADNVPKALQYVNTVEERTRRGDAGARVAAAMMARGHLNEAGQLLKQAIDNAAALKAEGKARDGGKNLATAYAGYCGRYAEVLYKQKNYPQALQYIQVAHDSSGTIEAQVNAYYADILIALGRNEEAFNIIDEAVKAGKPTESMKQDMDKLYRKVKGSYDGFDDYMAGIDRQLTGRTISRLPSRMIDEPAPAFTLQDVNGKTVSLDDYKGKTVVVDFWATWCGPCKASFPVMQTVVNKHKDDPDVQFLFIHTWERDGNPTREARQYIRSMKYTFEVLMDLKDERTGKNPVVQQFNVTGIPTKFVVDKNGHIRFRLVGFSRGNDAAAVDELEAMIQLAQKS